MTITRFKNVLFSMICICSATFSIAAQASDRHHYRNDQREVRHRGHQSTYQHIYYPHHRAYFSPHSRTWFWLEGSRWHSGIRLPIAINTHIGGIPIQLSTATPYYEHRYIERRYPRPHYRINERPHRHEHHPRHHNGNPRNW